MQTRYAWLFVRGHQSIRIVRPADGCSLVVSGPGHERRTYDFGDDVELTEFQTLYEQRLAGTGWILEEFEDRRSGSDRRHLPRHAGRRRE